MGETPIGTVRMSYLIDPYGLDGRMINGGNHYANADTPEAGRETAERMLHGERYLGYVLSKVVVYGREMRLGSECWSEVPGGRRDVFTVTRNDVGVPQA